MIPFVLSTKTNTMVTKIRSVVASGGRGPGGGWLTGKRHEESFMGDANILYLDFGDKYKALVKTDWTKYLRCVSWLGV